MLNILGQKHGGYCDQVSRRNFIKVGALGLGGLSLPQLLRAESVAKTGSSHKAIIMIYLPGGPPHQDMYDIKVDAPSGVRGEFSPISTKVPGIRICEHLPRLASMADKFIFVNSLVGSTGQHASFQCMTGRSNNNQPPGGWPEIGTVVSKVQGDDQAVVPNYINLSPKMQHRPYNFGKNSFVGINHRAFMPAGQIKSDMTLDGISMERLEDRQRLLSSFDRFRREVDASGMMEGMDSFQGQAFDLLTSSRLLEALDISKEDPKVRARYGKGTAKVQGDAAPRMNEQF
ncbi:MAG: DUF1501 domain-containing protein, partial [Akkermansiaceae bacterium]|nr:DUF1501 domain-containing protein [Akkermansiaceae bacterium]